MDRSPGFRASLVLYQGDNYGFSVPVVFRSKAQCEGNGHSLVEHWNAAAGHHRGALRVSSSTSTDCVPPLDKGMAIVGEASLAVNVDKLTELAIIILIEH
jgi:hypothetical protein